MWLWIKENIRGIVTAILTGALCIFLYSCESQTKSLVDPTRLINRAELQLELDQFMATAQLRRADLDRQDAFRALIIENSLLLVQGTPFNPVSLIMSIAGIYGFAHAASKSTKYVIKTKNKLKENNG
ncbi:hypothetical protein ES707_09386 [subsurface metagenome]